MNSHSNIEAEVKVLGEESEVEVALNALEQLLFDPKTEQLQYLDSIFKTDFKMVRDYPNGHAFISGQASENTTIDDFEKIIEMNFHPKSWMKIHFISGNIIFNVSDLNALDSVFLSPNKEIKFQDLKFVLNELMWFKPYFDVKANVTDSDITVTDDIFRVIPKEFIKELIGEYFIPFRNIITLNKWFSSSFPYPQPEGDVAMWKLVKLVVSHGAADIIISEREIPERRETSILFSVKQCDILEHSLFMYLHPYIVKECPYTISFSVPKENMITVYNEMWNIKHDNIEIGNII
jgi:hypothetical protein